MPTKTITHQQVIDLVLTLPPDCLISVYDFARYVQAHPLTAAAEFFDATEDEIRADEEQWDQQFAASQEQLRAIARETAEEFRAGRTKPMEFTSEGRLTR